MQLPKRHYQLANTDKWISSGEYNGTKGVWELVVNTKIKTVYHILFRKI